MSQQHAHRMRARVLSLVCASLAAVASGSGAAGAITIHVTDYYSAPDHSALVGRRVDGRCPRNPSPVNWGAVSDYPVTYTLTCAGGPIEP